MKRKIGTDPYSEAVWNNAHEWIGEIVESNAKEFALSPYTHFKNLKSILPGNGQDSNIEAKYLAALGLSLGRAISLTSDWSLKFILFEEHNFRNVDGVWSVVSSDHSTLFFPIAALRRDYYRQTHFSGSYANAIYSEDTPKNQAKAFEEWLIN